MNSDASGRNRTVKPETIFRAAVASLLTLAVLLAAIGAAWTQTDDTKPLDGSVLAVAVIDAQMEQTRRQVIFYNVDQAREACAEAAWRPSMHHAVQILADDPRFAPRVEKWATAWGEGLVRCYKGDMANASIGIAEASELKDSMLNTATADGQP